MRSTLLRVIFAAALAVASTQSWAPPGGFRPSPTPHPIEITRPPIAHDPIGAGRYSPDPLESTGPSLGDESLKRQQFQEIVGRIQRGDPLALKDLLNAGNAEDESSLAKRRAWAEYEKAKRDGVPDEVLQAILGQQDQFINTEDLNCCVFRRPWADWKNDTKRRSEEASFTQALKKDRLPKAALRLMVLSDSPHVNNAFIGKDGVPAKSRTRKSGNASKQDILDEIAYLSSHSKTDDAELYILAKHEQGELFLPNGEQVKVDELREYAKEKGVHIRIWGCNSGLIQSSGIRQSFDVLPLNRAIGKAMRSKNVVTRASFLNVLHRETGLQFVFDVLDYVAEEEVISASVRERNNKDRSTGASPGPEIGTFELGMPRGLGAPTASPAPAATQSAGAVSPAASASAQSPGDPYEIAVAAPHEGATMAHWVLFLVVLGGALGIFAFMVRTNRTSRAAI